MFEVILEISHYLYEKIMLKDEISIIFKNEESRFYLLLDDF